MHSAIEYRIIKLIYKSISRCDILSFYTKSKHFFFRVAGSSFSLYLLICQQNNFIIFLAIFTCFICCVLDKAWFSRQLAIPV